MADGHLNKCKECTKSDVRANYGAHRDRYAAYERVRSRLPHRRALNRKNTGRMRSQYPNKYRAHNAVNNALRDGRLERKPCERCGSLRVHGHHDDYNEPLNVKWLCPRHHKERHAELEALERVGF